VFPHLGIQAPESQGAVNLVKPAGEVMANHLVPTPLRVSQS
jgi:hypothetical protein